jgi:hypothetical protein
LIQASLLEEPEEDLHNNSNKAFVIMQEITGSSENVIDASNLLVAKYHEMKSQL